MGEARPRRATLAVKKVLGAPPATVDGGGVLAGLRIREIPLSFFSLEAGRNGLGSCVPRRSAVVPTRWAIIVADTEELLELRSCVGASPSSAVVVMEGS